VKENVCENQEALNQINEQKKFIKLKENSHDSTKRFKINMAQKTKIRQK
jgi:hypothetical protein